MFLSDSFVFVLVFFLKGLNGSGAYGYHGGNNNMRDLIPGPDRGIYPERLVAGAPPIASAGYPLPPYETGAEVNAPKSSSGTGENGEGSVEEDPEAVHADGHQQYGPGGKDAVETASDVQEGDDDATGADDDDSSSESSESSESQSSESSESTEEPSVSVFVGGRPGSAIPGHMIPEIGPLPDPLSAYRGASILLTRPLSGQLSDAPPPPRPYASMRSRHPVLPGHPIPIPVIASSHSSDIKYIDYQMVAPPGSSHFVNKISYHKPADANLAAYPPQHFPELPKIIQNGPPKNPHNPEYPQVQSESSYNAPTTVQRHSDLQVTSTIQTAAPPSATTTRDPNFGLFFDGSGHHNNKPVDKGGAASESSQEHVAPQPTSAPRADFNGAPITRSNPGINADAHAQQTVRKYKRAVRHQKDVALKGSSSSRDTGLISPQERLRLVPRRHFHGAHQHKAVLGNKYFKGSYVKNYRAAFPKA